MKIYSMTKSLNLVQLESLNDINRKDITWIKLTPDDLPRFEEISELTRIPLEDIKEFLVDDDEERSRLEQSKFVKIIYRAPFIQNEEITTQPLCIFTISKFIVTIQKDNIRTISNIEQKLNKKLLKFLFKWPTTGRFIAYLLDKINDEFFNTIEKIPSIVRKIQSVDYDISTDVVKQLYSANITLSHFNHSIQANLDVLFTLRKSYTRLFTANDKDNFNDLYYDALHLLDTERTNRDIITNIFNFQNIISSNRTNELFKKLAAYALIIAIPTLISSIYGMNVNLPGMSSPFAFLGIMVLMILLSFGFFLIFLKSDWI